MLEEKKYVGENVQGLPPNFLKAMNILILLKCIFQTFGPEKYSRPQYIDITHIFISAF